MLPAGAVAAAIVCLAVQAHAGSIAGTVRSSQSGKPLPGVVVSLGAGRAPVTADSLGAFGFDTVNAGTYNLSFSREGYEALVRNDVYVGGSACTRLDVELSPAVYQLDRLTVRATAFRKAPDMASSTKTMDFDELLRQPGALADVQRAVRDLPSVGSGGDNVNEVVVRGGVPGENLFVMDNMEIPNPNHFAEQGTGGGVISLINPLMVKGLTFSAGAPPAQYGGKASSVLDVTLRDGNDKMVVGGFDMGIAGVGGYAEGPLWPGAVFLGSAAKSYLDLAASFDASVAVPRYWGAQAKLTQKIGGGRLAFDGIYGDNTIRIGQSHEQYGTRGDVIESGGFVYAAGATAASFWGDRVSGRVTVSATGNSFDRREYTPPGEALPPADYFTNASTELEQTLGGELAVDIGESDRLSIGAFGRRADFDLAITELPDTLIDYSAVPAGAPVIDSGTGGPVVTRAPLLNNAVGYKYGGYASAIVYLASRLKLIPGIRADGFTTNHSATVSPRLGAVLSLTSALDLTGAAGVQYQDPDYADLAAAPANPTLMPKRAMTGIAGLEYALTQWSVKATVEGFYKRYNDLPVDSSLLSPSPFITAFTRSPVRISGQSGDSYGIEAYVHKKLTKSFSGSAAYSYSRSWRDDVRPGHEHERYPADFDFRDNVSLTGGWKAEPLSLTWYRALREKLWFKLLSPVMPIADRIELSAQWRYLGGRPYSQPDSLARYRIWGVPTAGPINAARYPAYHSLDVRFERRFGFGFLRMIYYIDLQNVYDRRNIWHYLWVDGRLNAPVAIYQLSFFPAGGIIIGL